MFTTAPIPPLCPIHSHIQWEPRVPSRDYSDWDETGNIPYHLLTMLRKHATVQLYRHSPTRLSAVQITLWHTQLHPIHLHSAETPLIVNLLERVSPVVQATSPTMLYGAKRGHLAGVQLYTVGVFTWLRSVKVSPCVHISMTDKSAAITFHTGFSRGVVQALHFSLRQKKRKKKKELPIYLTEQPMFLTEVIPTKHILHVKRKFSITELSS